MLKKKINVIYVFVIVLISVGIISCSLNNASNPAMTDSCFEKLPPYWTVTESFALPQDQISGFKQKFGTKENIIKLSNTKLSVQGQQIQVNIIDCANEEDAKKVEALIAKMKSDPAFCIRTGTKIVEFVGNSVQLAIKTGFELGFVEKPARIKYHLTARIAPVDKCDYMKFNELFNLFLQVQNDPGNNFIKSKIDNLSKNFDFGKMINLRYTTDINNKPVYIFEPKPLKSQVSAHGEAITYTFGNMPNSMNVPYSLLNADIYANKDGITATNRQVTQDLLSANKFWPVNDPQIISLSQKITGNHQTDEAKVDAILKWLQPGDNIKFGGPVQGSRWGVKKVLDQKYGQCWDFSDCFITLCRASGIPCRQVGGWLYGCSGHIWAEVLFKDKGWKQVDPTGGGILECGIYHIPYFTSEDGEMPILYLSMPQIEIKQ